MPTISRRNFVNGTLMALGASALPFGCRYEDFQDQTPYPPALHGLRGSHPGSNTHAHQRAWNKKSNWGKTRELGEEYDLVVVGGGISGLSAAHFFLQKNGWDKKVLILDNHDDFGGHAKRNEHQIDGKTILGHGGSQTIVEPNHASKAVLDLFTNIGIDLDLFKTAYDREFYSRHDLSAVTYFNKAEFGVDKVVRHPFCNYPNYVEGILMDGGLTQKEAADQTPLSSEGKKQLLSVLEGGLHRIDVPEEQLRSYINTTSYFDYLKNTLGVTDEKVLKMARNSGLDWAQTGTDLMTISAAKSCGALGFKPKAVYDEKNPYIYHFPDGNATVARAIVKKLIPKISASSSISELITSKFDYSHLDRSNNNVRIRLNSTVVDVKHINHQQEVSIQYIQNNKSYHVKGKNVVMACYNMIIPHIVSDLPQKQAEALRQQTKSPLIYTTVGLKNWRAFKEAGIGLAMSPGNMHQAVFMDFPVSVGKYQYTQTPDDPCVIQMISCPYGKEMGTPAKEQYKEARYQMLSRKFEDYEMGIRDHLKGMLSPDLFDFDTNVSSITVNRWAHGYTVPGSANSVQIGRKPYGRMAIANCDSSPGSDAKNAIDMAHRAVNELA